MDLSYFLVSVLVNPSYSPKVACSFGGLSFMCLLVSRFPCAQLGQPAALSMMGGLTAKWVGN